MQIFAQVQVVRLTLLGQIWPAVFAIYPARDTMPGGPDPHPRGLGRQGRGARGAHRAAAQGVHSADRRAL